MRVPGEPGRTLAVVSGVGAAAVIILAVVLLVGAYTFLPALVEGVVARDLENNLGLSRTPEVSLSADPAYEMLAGNFDSGEVVFREPEFAGVRPERVRVRLDGLGIDLSRSVFGGGLELDGPVTGEVRITLSEEELGRIAGAGIESGPVREVGVSGGGLTVGSSARVLGVRVPISVKGPVDVEGGEIVFSPEEAAAFGTTLPAGVADRILSEADFGYPVEDLPFDGEVTGVETGEGELILEGSVQDLPVESVSS